MHRLITATLLWSALAGAQPPDPDALIDTLEHIDSARVEETREALAARAEDGDVRAQYWLGRLLHDLVPLASRDFEAGRTWLERAADNGHTDAAEALGRIYEAGFVVARDIDKAHGFYERAMELGSASAPHDLARIALTRDDRDEAGILRLLELAAERGYRNAMIDLGFTYASGALGEVDGNKARNWAERGIELRDPRAMNLMARLYASGIGVSDPDGIEALKWAMLAREFGDPDAARLATEIAGQLEVPQQDEARERAEAWRAEHR